MIARPRPQGDRRVALVTGGARRLGRRIARRLLDDGFGVVITYLRSEDDAIDFVARGTQRGGYARAVRADVADKVDVAALFASIEQVEGRLDLLVNNVGIYHPRPLVDETPEGWDDTLAANLSGAFYCCFHARPLLEARGGQIVNVGYAGSDSLGANVDATAYQISKAGLLLLTRSLAASLGPRGIRVNMVSPGQLENSVDLPSDLPATIPLGRAGTLDDVYGAIDYLLGADYVTGAHIEVAGGYRL